MKIIFVLLTIFAPLLANAQGIKRTRESVELNKSSLIVTHASRTFVDNEMIKEGIDHWVKEFKLQGLPIVYLMNNDDSTDSNWFTEDRDPTYAIESTNGDHHISIKSSEITVTGGFFTLCFDRTVEAVINSSLTNQVKDITIRMPLEAIYEDKSLFMAAMNLKFEEIDFFFSIEGHRSLKFFKDNLSRHRFIRGLKTFFDYKKDLSYEVFLDGKKILVNRPLKHKTIRIIFI